MLWIVWEEEIHLIPIEQKPTIALTMDVYYFGLWDP